MHQASAAQAYYQRIGRFIYAFHRLANPEHLRALPGSGAMPAQMAERGEALARRFDEAMASGKPDDAEGRVGERSERVPGDAWPSADALQSILADLQAFVADSGWTHGPVQSR